MGSSGQKLLVTNGARQALTPNADNVQTDRPDDEENEVETNKGGKWFLLARTK